MEMVLYHLLGQAINDPGAIVGERQQHRAGREGVKAWQLRAVTEVLKQQGVDPTRTPLRERDYTSSGSATTRSDGSRCRVIDHLEDRCS